MWSNQVFTYRWAKLTSLINPNTQLNKHFQMPNSSQTQGHTSGENHKNNSSIGRHKLENNAIINDIAGFEYFYIIKLIIHQLGECVTRNSKIYLQIFCLYTR